MPNSQSRQWKRIAEALPVTRPLANAIAQYEQHDFQLLWMLSDYVQFCVKYGSLLLLADAFHDPQLRGAMFHTTFPDNLARNPSFGTWLAFLRRSIQRLRTAGLSATQPGLLEFLSQSEAQIHHILTKRNTLAHGTFGRFVIDPSDVDEFMQSTLFVAEAAQLFCTQPLPASLSPDTLVQGSHLYPFILSDGRQPLFYENVASDAIYVTYQDAISRPDVTTLVERFLKYGLTNEGGAEAQGTAKSIYQHSQRLVAQYRQRIDDSYLGQELLLCHLPEHAGRQPLFAYMREAIADAKQPLAYHLYGRFGMGKRRFLAELLQALSAEGHLVVPLCAADLEAAPISSAWNRLLQVDGSLSDLCQWLSPDGSTSVILALDDLASVTRHPHRKREMAELLDAQRHLDHIHFIGLSQTTQPLAESWASVPAFVQLPFPLMEESARSRFYVNITDKLEDAPLTTWTTMPAAAKRLAAVPIDLVRLCRRFPNRLIHADIEINHDLQEPWDSDMDELWNRVVLADVALRQTVSQLAEDMVRCGERYAIRDVIKAKQEGDSSSRVAEERLSAMGVITEAMANGADSSVISIAFTQYYYLVRALQLVPPLGPVQEKATRVQFTNDELHQVLQRCSDFTPFGDALALQLAADPERLEATFTQILQHRTPVLNRLVEAFLVRAYPYPETFDAVVARALDDGASPVLSGCGAAAQQLVESNMTEAKAEGVRIYAQLIDVCRRQGDARLEATFLNEFGMWGISNDTPWDRRRCFDQACSLAESLQLEEVYTAARLNRASIDVDVAHSRLEAEPTDAHRILRAVITDLSHTSAEVTFANWRSENTRLELLGRAHTLLNTPTDLEQVEQLDARRFDDIGRFGSAIDLAWAYYHRACELAYRQSFNEALKQFTEVIHWMTIGGDDLGVVHGLLGRSDTLVAQAQHPTASRSQVIKQLRSAIRQYRKALGILDRFDEDERTFTLLTQLWRGMGAALQQCGEEDQARECLVREQHIARKLGNA